MDFIQIQFKNKYSGEFEGRAYTYIADIPVKVGDLVKCPTYQGDGVGKVSRTGISEAEARGSYKGDFRHISAFADDEKAEA